ncbi:MAG TPA: carboxypeptidase-like regulatory domain-containing protein, partial [Bacteroidales bacterium]|nr:carboxypeptidase-like regulatory domain-containing protein [Bacteroidales bacterium]
MSGSMYRPGDRIRKWLIAGLFLISVTWSYGQDNRLTLRFDNISFRDLVDTLEKRVPYKFYYADEWADSLYLNINLADVTFEEVLNRSLRPAGFSFIITAGNKVILSKGSSVKTSFRDEYIGYLERNLTNMEAQDFVPPAVKEKESAISDEYRIFRIGQPASGQNASNAVLSGRVISTEDGKSVNGVIVYIEKLKMGAMTNDAGYYSVILPKGQYRVEFRMIGMQTARRNIVLYSSGTLNIDMNESTSEVEAVVITGNR